jgi:hypothetical protein
MGFDLLAVHRPEVRAYFNGTAMSFLLKQMAACGLLDTATRAPTWSEMQQDVQVLARRSSHALQIPRFKFWTNDGWVVTAEECYLLYHRLRGHPDPCVQRFVAFAAQCVPLGGFAVH